MKSSNRFELEQQEIMELLSKRPLYGPQSHQTNETDEEQNVDEAVVENLGKLIKKSS